MDGEMDEWMDRSMNMQIFVCVCLCICVGNRVCESVAEEVHDSRCQAVSLPAI
jgi:hypothetical protein